MKRIKIPIKPGLYGFAISQSHRIDFVNVRRMSTLDKSILLKCASAESLYFHNLYYGYWYKPSLLDRFRLAAARRLGLIKWKNTSWVCRLQHLFAKILGFM
jgi:hypothetical protein